MLAACYAFLTVTALAASGDGPAGGFEWAKETLRSDIAACLPLEGLPEELEARGVQTVWIAAGNPGDSLVLRALGVGGGDTLDLGPVEFEGWYNPAKGWWSYSDSTGMVTFHSQYPFRATYDAASYRVTVGIPWLMLDSTWSGDPSMEAMQRIDSLLPAGRIAEAAEELGEVFYPHNYFLPAELSVRFLEAAHAEALDRWRTGDAEGALEAFDAAEEAFELTTFDTDWHLQQGGAEDLAGSDYGEYIAADRLAEIANDYGFFLYEAGRAEEALEALVAVLLLDPDRAVAHLNTADVLWELGREEAARRHYSRYLALLQEKGLDVEVPPRVNSRLRSVPDVN